MDALPDNTSTALKGDYTLNLDPAFKKGLAGQTWYFGPFGGAANVYLGSEQDTYQPGSGVSDNAAYVSAGTDAAHELTHRIGHIRDLPYKGEANAEYF